MNEEIVLPAPCLVVLIGMSGSGKTTWARAHFATNQIVSSDALRAVVGAGDDDITASDDAFKLLEQIVATRVRRRLTTVVDTLGLDAGRRRGWVAQARAHGLTCVAVAFGIPVAEARARNREREKAVPQRVLSGQARQFREQVDHLADEGFAVVLTESATVRTAPPHLAASVSQSAEQHDTPAALTFGLQIPTFDWPGGATEARTVLPTIARAAEDAGFTSLWLMDHHRQIPMFGPDWHDMLESYTALAFLAAHTERVRLGTLVTAISHRHVAHLGRIVGTLDVVSGGRAECGLGVGWYAAENTALGIPFPSVSERYALLEDALKLLPLLWGKGAPSFEGRMLRVPQAMAYPRPLQEHVPILVGGNGERRTLQLAARYADACNMIGERDVVSRKIAALRSHCEDAGRDPSSVRVTQLSTTLVAPDASGLSSLVERLRPRRVSAEQYATRVNAGTVDDQIGRFRALAAVGVQTAIVSLPGLAHTAPIEYFAAVIRALAA